MPSEEHVIAVVTLNVTAKEFDAAARTATSAILQRAVALPGFINGMVLTDETRTHLLVHMEWASRESWAKAEWDQVIANDVVNLFEQTASYDVRLYFPLARTQGVDVTAPHST